MCAGKLPKIGGLASYQRQHVPIEGTEREYVICRVIVFLMRLFLLWETHVVLSFSARLQRAAPSHESQLLAPQPTDNPSRIFAPQRAVVQVWQSGLDLVR